MQKSSISPTCLQQVFDSATNAAAKGQAQYFTPADWAAALSLPLPKHRPVIIDLQCGAGNLLTAASNRSTKHTLGCDIDRPVGTTSTSSPTTIAADLTLLYPLLKSIEFQADLFVLNPPWDLHWHRDRLAGLANSECLAVRTAFNALDPRINSSSDSPVRGGLDSTIATLCIALDLCSKYGEGFLIANAATVDRLIFAPNAPHAALAAHIWAHIIIDGNICLPSSSSSSSSSKFHTSILYFARSHTSGFEPDPIYPIDIASAQELCSDLFKQRLRLRHGADVRYTHLGLAESESTLDRWTAAAEEWSRLHSPNLQPSTFNLQLSPNGTIATHLSLFDDFTGRIPKEYAAKLNDLNGRHPLQLVIQRSHRKALEQACGLAPWPRSAGFQPAVSPVSNLPASPFRVDPALIAAVQKAITDYNAIRAPLYPLSDIQRLGYLDEQDDILCTKDLFSSASSSSIPIFVAGSRYPLRSTTARVKRKGQKRNVMGELDDVEYDGQELAFFISTKEPYDMVAKCNPRREYCFMDARLRDQSVTVSIPKPHTRKDKALRKLDDLDCEPCPIDFTLQQLAAHFEIPAVPDVAALNPTGFQSNLKLLADIEAVCA